MGPTVSPVRSVAPDAGPGYQYLAIISVGVLTGSYLAVLYHVVDVVGGVGPFLLLVVVALGLGAGSRYVSRRGAFGLAVLLLVLGLAFYVNTMPASDASQLSPGRIVADTVSMLTGYSVLRLTNAHNWALAVTAGPTFLTWYFAARNEYSMASVVGGLTLGFFVLTGDSGQVGTLLGVLGASGAVGFGTLLEYDATASQGEVLAIIFALMILGAGTVAAVPGAVSTNDPSGGPATGGDLTSAGPAVSIGGSIELSPRVLFTVTAEEPAYWRVATYDRFTGRTWIRTGMEGESASHVPRPKSGNHLDQRFTARRPMSVYPAAATPVSVSGIDAQVTEAGTIRADTHLDTNDTYTVRSQRPTNSPRRLAAAGTAYPPAVREKYLQVSESTPDRVHALGDRIAGNVSGPYAKARAIERWLERSKAYSLEVSNPQGNVADAFLFEMTQGYCVYYATAMTVLLRTQGVPARFVVGYSPGQHVSADTWVVRGLNSHAWVEVYVPDVGWVRFDPTPEGPRIRDEHGRIQAARQAEEEAVDALGSRESNLSTPTDSADVSPTTNGTALRPDALREGDEVADILNTSPGDGTTDQSGSNALGGRGIGTIPFTSPKAVGLWIVVVIGVVAGFRRGRLGSMLTRQVWLIRPPTGSPGQRIETAYDRVEYLLERRYRTRRSAETAREYVRDVSTDERIHTLIELRERSRYGAEATETAARRAIGLSRAVIEDLGGSSVWPLATLFNRLIS